MNALNQEFLEEFKSLERLCGDIYQSKHGVSCYIDNMKAVSSFDCRSISNWNAILENLIKIRRIRNSLVHEEDTFNKDVCTKDDIEWIGYFYRCILNQSDPLARLRKAQTVKKSNAQNRKVIDNVQNHIETVSADSNYKEHSQNDKQLDSNNVKIRRVAVIFLIIYIIIFLILLGLVISYKI